MGIGYAGHVNDISTGLSYQQQRYYDPLLGRFITPDPVVTNLNSGGNFNRYWYANNSPYRYRDPDGRDPWGAENQPPPPPPPPPVPAQTITIVGQRITTPTAPTPPIDLAPVIAIARQALPWALVLVPSQLAAPPCEMSGGPACGVLSRPTIPPRVGPPGGFIQGPRRGRQYGPDGRPVLDIDKPHQGNQKPHAHEWPNGEREEPGRDVSPWPPNP